MPETKQVVLNQLPKDETASLVDTETSELTENGISPASSPINDRKRFFLNEDVQSKRKLNDLNKSEVSSTTENGDLTHSHGEILQKCSTCKFSLPLSAYGVKRCIKGDEKCKIKKTCQACLKRKQQIYSQKKKVLGQQNDYGKDINSDNTTKSHSFDSVAASSEKPEIYDHIPTDTFTTKNPNTPYGAERRYSIPQFANHPETYAPYTQYPVRYEPMYVMTPPTSVYYPATYSRPMASMKTTDSVPYTSMPMATQQLPFNVIPQYSETPYYTPYFYPNKQPMKQTNYIYQTYY
ncbi:hypothetical protein WA158_001923 [Blastocystis sp. Blastoise]